MTHSTDMDGALLAAWTSARDQEAFRMLCERHTAQVAATCRRHGSLDADEATQAVFLILARRSASVTGSNLAGWLHGTARRVVAHQRRASDRRRRHEQKAGMQLAAQHTASVSEPAWAEARQHLDQALASLSPGRREAVLRFHLLGMSQAQIAAELGCSAEAVKTRVHEGVKHLRAFIARRGVVLSSAALVAGLASECAAAEPALIATCTQCALVPASAPGALALTNGVTTTMLIKITSLTATGTVLVGACITAALLAAAEPQQPTPAPVAVAAVALDPSANAALDWWRAMALLPPEQAAVWKLAQDKNSRLPDQAADAFFSADVESLNLLALGAANNYCDWGVDLAAEPMGALQPHLVKMGSAIRLGVLRARWHAEQGNGAAAVDDLLTVLRASRLMPGRGGVMVDFLTGYSNESRAITAIGRLALKLDAKQRQRLLAALPGLPAGATGADVLHRELAVQKIRLVELLKHPKERRAQMLPKPISNLDRPVQPGDIGSYTDANLKTWFEGYERDVTRLLEVLRLPADERLRRVEAMVPDLAPNLFSDALMPSWKTIVTSEVQMQLVRDELLVGLEYLDVGDAALTKRFNVLNGKPFNFEKKESGFRLHAEIPGKKRAVAALLFGEPSPFGTPVPEPGTQEF